MLYIFFCSIEIAHYEFLNVKNYDKLNECFITSTNYKVVKELLNTE